jgi:hypothetical protein
MVVCCKLPGAAVVSHDTLTHKVKFKVMLRPTVSRQVSLGVKRLSGAYDQIFITVRQLRVCWCGALSLTRDWVCRLQFLLGLASAVILGSKSRGTRDHILLSQIQDPPNWRARFPYLYPPGTGWPSYNPRHWVPFSSLPTIRRTTVEVLEPASTRGLTHTQVKVILRPTVGRPVCPGVKHPFVAYDQNFITVRRLRICWCGALSLSRELVCRLQMLLVFVSAVILGLEFLGTRDNILMSQIRDSTNLEGQISVFMSPRNRLVQLYPQALGSLFVAS